jgi:hypothetical protein
MKHSKSACIVVAVSILVVWLTLGNHRGERLVAADGSKITHESELETDKLKEQLKKLESLIPDQAAVMTHVAYHFTNLYIAVQHDNWPLADFYLGETVNNIKWAVRAKPIRKNSAGQEIDLAAIAQALENTQFNDLKQAIAAKDKGRCVKVYEQTLAGCYACHSACGKPYLQLRAPAQAEVNIINFAVDPVNGK